VTTHDEPTVTNSGPNQPGNRTRRVAVIALVAVALAGAGALAVQSRSEPGGTGAAAVVTSVPMAPSTTAAPATTTAAPTSTAATSTTAVELSDAAACGRWYDLRYFAGAGLLNAPDVVGKAKAIQDIAATPAVRLPATHLHDAAVQKNLQGLADAIGELNAACT
jgi:hypothetical protein